MTEKRFVTIESGIDYGVIDTVTDERIFDEDITAKLNELYGKMKESYNFGVDTEATRLYTKTSVEDIIGLVKTEEQTNSVSLKKEAQLSICEKRLMELEKENERLKEENQKLMKALGESGRMAVDTLLPKDEDTLTLNGKWW